MRIKQWVALTLIVVTCSLVAGCGAKPTPTTGADAPKAPDVPPGGP